MKIFNFNLLCGTTPGGAETQHIVLLTHTTAAQLHQPTHTQRLAIVAFRKGGSGWVNNNIQTTTNKLKVNQVQT